MWIIPSSPCLRLLEVQISGDLECLRIKSRQYIRNNEDLKHQFIPASSVGRASDSYSLRASASFRGSSECHGFEPHVGSFFFVLFSLLGQASRDEAQHAKRGCRELAAYGERVRARWLSMGHEPTPARPTQLCLPSTTTIPQPPSPVHLGTPSAARMPPKKVSLPPNPPPDPSQNLPLAYTNFFSVAPVNAKSESSCSVATNVVVSARH